MLYGQKSVSLNYSSALPMKHHDQCHIDEVSPSIKAELNPHCCLMGNTSCPWHSQPEPRQEPAEPPCCRLQSLAPLSGARAAPPAPPGLARTASCPPTHNATFCGSNGWWFAANGSERCCYDSRRDVESCRFACGTLLENTVPWVLFALEAGCRARAAAGTWGL